MCAFHENLLSKIRPRIFIWLVLAILCVPVVNLMGLILFDFENIMYSDLVPENLKPALFDQLSSL